MKFCQCGIAMAFTVIVTACSGVDPNPYGKLLSVPTLIDSETTTDLDNLTQQNGLTGLPGVPRNAM